MEKAIDIFNNLEKGILNIIKAADVYGLYLISDMRNTDPSKESIKKIIKSHSLTLFTLVGEVYRDDEIKFLTESSRLKQIGQQILLSSYTAFEIYLIEKFKEYYKFLSKNKDDCFIEETLKRFNVRSIDNIKDNYKDLLAIHLDCFEIKFDTAYRCNFSPKSSWEAIRLIEKARNHIVHRGESKEYKIVTLMDSWYPFDFIRRWVMLFDCNFDDYIYKKREYNAIKDYKKRVSDKDCKLKTINNGKI